MLRLDWCLRMLMAALCGGIIGFERKSKAKMAGIRTHALIAVGAAMVMIISKYGFFDLMKITHSIGMLTHRGLQLKLLAELVFWVLEQLLIVMIK